MAISSISSILRGLNLSTLIRSFEDDRIDSVEVALSLTDLELARLGITTIGDRIRFRERLRQCKESERPSTTPNAASLMRPAALFHPRRPNHLHSRKLTSRITSRPWTTTFFCLAERNMLKAPSGDEKNKLIKAGLGQKKITLQSDDTEFDVCCKLEGEFGQLRDCGGFELLKWTRKDNALELVEGRYDVKNLKTRVGSQCNIYIRPIQKDLDTSNTETEEGASELKTSCMECGGEYLVSEMRVHVQQCNVSQMSDHRNGGSAEDTDTGSVYNSTSTDTEQLNTEQQPVYNSTSTDTEQLNNEQQPVYNSTSTDTEQQNNEQQPVYNSTSTDTEQLNDEQQPVYNSTSTDTEQLNNEQQPVYNSNSTMSTDTEQLNNEQQPHENMGDTTNNIEATQSTQNMAFETTIENCISYLKQNYVNDPVLRYIQKRIVQGRPLEVGDESQLLEGETNFIIVNRSDVLRTGFQEIQDLDNLRLTLEVEFYDEEARDFGGPRKEFFGMMLRAIKRKYFEPVRAWSDDYETVGKILGRYIFSSPEPSGSQALSTLQNGLLPKVMKPDLVQELFGDNPRPFMMDLRRGLDSLGLYKIAVELPSFQQLFVPTTVPLTLRMMKHVLQPNFSEEGSNRKKLEQLMYSVFVRYLREASAGRRGEVTLNKVLKFATGSPEEPVLGYNMKPSINFVMGSSFLPTANTCINRLQLTIPNKESEMPEEKFLFNFFDYAFSNDFYGMQ